MIIEDDIGLQPGKDVNTITVHSILQEMEFHGNRIPLKNSKKIEDLIDKIDHSTSKTPDNVLLKDI